ncbi:MAG TPA: Clp protease ClpP [Candidatus Rifleibacterium sp.]|nr:Clp protease ClpP [Candidatus Rifleibacterium sp.]
MNNKLRLKALARQKSAVKAQGNELMLYGTIGSYYDELDGKKIVEQIKAMTGNITVRVNSPGGDVFDGIAIMNALKDHGKEKGSVTVIVEALAASIASVIAVGAADELIMQEGSYLMVHNPWTIAIGDAKEFEQVAGVLRQLSGTLASIYARKTGKDKDEMQALMDAETWIDSAKALELGFADKAEGEEPASVENFDLSMFDKVPEELRIAAKGAKPTTIRDFEKILRNAGFSRSEARAVASNGFGALDQREAETEKIDSARLLAALETAKQTLKG